MLDRRSDEKRLAMSIKVEETKNFNENRRMPLYGNKVLQRVCALYRMQMVIVNSKEKTITVLQLGLEPTQR